MGASHALHRGAASPGEEACGPKQEDDDHQRVDDEREKDRLVGGQGRVDEDRDEADREASKRRRHSRSIPPTTTPTRTTIVSSRAKAGCTNGFWTVSSTATAPASKPDTTTAK